MNIYLKKESFSPFLNRSNFFIRRENNSISSMIFTFNQMNKAFNRQNLNYNNIIGNLDDFKNISVDEGAKLLIHSERIKIRKIFF